MENNPQKFLALLRGINVGGKNIIGKDDLRQAFVDLGYTKVRTYIQSGNILFRSDEVDVGQLTKAIEQQLSDRFSYTARAVVLSEAQYNAAVEAAPDTWGKDDLYKHNALFTLSDITPTEVTAKLPPPKQEIETVTLGPGVIFWSGLKEQLTKTTFMKLPTKPVYKLLTIRNHNTTFKLLKLFDEI